MSTSRCLLSAPKTLNPKDGGTKGLMGRPFTDGDPKQEEEVLVKKMEVLMKLVGT